MKQAQGFILILDISGYTRFVRSHNLRHIPLYGKHFRRMSEAHAEQVVSDLLETLVRAMGDEVRVEKFEGDAVLLSVLTDEPDAIALGIVDRLQGIFPAFHQRIHELAFCRTCLCDCCSQMGELRVKAIAHFGPFLVKEVLGQRELAGQEMIRAHRLLKNQVEGHEYLLLTDAFVQLESVQGALDLERHVEQDPELGSTQVWVHHPTAHSVFEGEHAASYLARVQQMRTYFKEPSRVAAAQPL